MESEHTITARAIVRSERGARLVREPDALRSVPLEGSEQLVDWAMDFGSAYIHLVKSPGCPAWPAMVMAERRKPDGAKP